MYRFIEKGMRRKTSHIAHRYGHANNKYMKNCDKNEKSKYIMYLDANNLYGWAMSQYFPTGQFRWMKGKEMEKLDLAKYNDNSKTFLKLILNIPKNYAIYIMITLLVLNRSK